ncbi:response regulator [Pontibacter toksunensis]|uniref:histidine kinase n=1 Tax=Pontibacter toksunensis TaxID=1332631 RepID=A0ABW6BX19_9BACT
MEFTRQVIQTNPNPTYVKNENGRFILANDAFAELHGLTVDELLDKGTGVFDYSFERDLEVLQKNEPTSIEEYYKLKNGEKAWFKTTKKPFEQADGTRFLLSVSSNITLLKQAVQAAEDSAKAKENFLASISNEIRTPINAIIGIARVMRKGLLNQDQEGYLDTISSIAENLLVVPNDLLDITKLESGEVKLESVPFDVASVLSDAVKAMAYKTQGQNVSVRFTEPTETLPVVEGDPFRLSQVLVNLMNNAIKHTRQGEITVTVRHTKMSDDILTIECCVEDTGAVYMADKFRNISDILNKEQSITRLYGGTGLGLTISKKLLELQGGKLWLENRKGQGNCFYFSVPYTLSKKPIAYSKEDASIDPEKLSGLHILIAEDNHLNELLLCSQLQPLNVQTDVAYDGEQALAKANEKEYDLILMDIQMPKLDGIEATYRIRNKQNPNRHTPIIAFTANYQKIDRERYRLYGFTDTLLKPYGQSKLYNLILRYTGRNISSPTTPSQSLDKEATDLFDFSGLGNLKDDAMFIRKMQQMFIDTVPGQLNELTEAVENKDLETAAHIAHKLKSTFGNIRVKTATEEMKKIEEFAKNRSNFYEIQRLILSVREVINLVVEAFSEQLQATK